LLKLACNRTDFAAVVPEQLASLELPEMAAAEAELLEAFPIKPKNDFEASAACAAIQDVPRLHNQQIASLFQEASAHQQPGVLHAKVGISVELG
jgi:hypothetical protein